MRVPLPPIPRLLREFDYEWDAGVEPVAVQILDLGPGRAAAQMKTALAVVDEVHCLADCLSCLLQLGRVTDLSRDTGTGSAPQSQANVRVASHVPHPERDGQGSLDCQCGRAEHYDVHLVVAPDRTNVVPALLAGLSSGRREHPCPGGVKIAKTRSVIALRMRPPLADCSSRLCFGAALIAAARIASARTVTASSPDVEPLLGASVISSLFKCSAVV